MTLFIPGDHKLTLYGNETDIFESPIIILLSGKLELSPITNIHLKYTILSLEDRSELSIMQTKENKFKIIVEQIFNSGCGPSSKKVMISIQSQQVYMSGEIKEIIADNQFQFANASLLQLNQPVQIYNLDDLSDQQSYLRITGISDNVVTVDQPILHSHLQKRSEVIRNPLAIFSYADYSDIIFKNTCISARFTEISGVVFLNPQKLHLAGNKVKNCLFLNDSNYTLQEDQIFMLQAHFEQNTFINLTNIILEAAVYSISSNVFYKIIDGNIYSPKQLEQNYFLKSEFKIHFEKELECQFSQSIIHFSNLEIMNQLEAAIQFQLTFGFICQISFSQHINFLTLTDSTLIEPLFKMNKMRISSHIEMKRCYFFSSNNRTSFFLLSRELQEENENNFKVILRNCQISGIFKSFIDFTKEPLSSIIDDVQKPLVVVLWYSVMNTQSQFEGQRFVEGIQTRYITSKFKQDVELIHIEGQTFYNDQQSIKKITFFSQKFHLIRKQESYYRFKYLQNRNYEEIQNYILQINSGFNQQIHKNEHPLFQILDSQSQQLDLMDFSFRSLFFSAFSLEITNVHPWFIATGRYQLVFPEFQDPILRIGVVSQFQAKATYLPFESAIFTYEGLNIFARQNRLVVEWTSEKIQNITLQIELIYCEKGQSNHGAYCQNYCLQKRQGSYCTESCHSGYYLINENNCQQCPVGCKSCDKHLQCVECFENYFKVSDQCYFYIPKGYFRSPANSLIKCNQSEEESCYERNNCFACRDMYANVATEECNKTEPQINSDECFACNSECQSCFGQNKLSCYSCSQEPSNYYYGQCM